MKMEVCDYCMEEDILLRRFDKEFGGYYVYCPKCVLEGYFDNGLIEEDFKELKGCGISKKSFLKDWDEIYIGFYGKSSEIKEKWLKKKAREKEMLK